MLEIKRRIFTELTRNIFPVENAGDTSGFIEADEHLARGNGLFLLYIHFSSDDPVRIFNLAIEKIPFARRVSILSPVAYHQYNIITKLAAFLNGTELLPIVTRDTKTSWKKRGFGEQIPEENRRAMFDQYKQRAIEVLNEGGIVAISPQSGRKSTSGEPPEGKPIWQILSAYEEKYGSTKNVGMLCVGLGLVGEQNYEKTRGYNPGRKYTASVSSLLLPKQMRDMVKGFASIDEQVFGIFRTLVPIEYR